MFRLKHACVEEKRVTLLTPNTPIFLLRSAGCPACYCKNHLANLQGVRTSAASGRICTVKLSFLPACQNYSAVLYVSLQEYPGQHWVVMLAKDMKSHESGSLER